MARKKAEPKKTAKPNNNAYIEGAGLVADEKITMSLEKNYMPYAMSVLVSRALKSGFFISPIVVSQTSLRLNGQTDEAIETPIPTLALTSIDG